MGGSGTGTAAGARVEDGVIKRVAGHFAGQVGWGDGAWVGGGREVEEEVRAQNGGDGKDFVNGGHQGPGGGQVEVGRDGEEEEEED